MRIVIALVTILLPIGSLVSSAADLQAYGEERSRSAIFLACDSTAAVQCQKGSESCQRTCELSSFARGNAAAVVACKQNCINSYSTCMTRARC